eukprot:7153442-Prymnesium_polylepis.1
MEHHQPAQGIASAPLPSPHSSQKGSGGTKRAGCRPKWRSAGCGAGPTRCGAPCPLAEGAQ